MRIVLDCDNGKDPTTVFFFFFFLDCDAYNFRNTWEPVPFLCHVSVPVSGLYA